MRMKATTAWPGLGGSLLHPISRSIATTPPRVALQRAQLHSFKDQKVQTAATNVSMLEVQSQTEKLENWLAESLVDVDFSRHPTT